jgi:hypothetical protein
MLRECSLFIMIASTDRLSREWPGTLIKILEWVLMENRMMFISPAQGAVFAPLALKFVKWTLHLFIPD